MRLSLCVKGRCSDGKLFCIHNRGGVNLHTKVVRKIFSIDMFSALFGVVLIGLALSLIPSTSKEFLSAYNIDALGRTTAITILAGIAQLAVLSIGQFNLAIGAMGCLSAMLSAHMMEVMGFPIIVAIFFWCCH